MIRISYLISISGRKKRFCRALDNKRLRYFGNKRHVQNFVFKSFKPLLSTNNQSPRLIVRTEKGYKFDNETLSGFPRLPCL